MIEILVIYIRLLGQFQTFYFFFTKIFYTHKKHKNVKQATFAQMFFICTKKQKVHKKHKTSSIVNEVIWVISQAQKE